MKQLLTILAVAIGLSAQAQLPNGSVAPDFTLTDYYGTEHDLYTYLNQGKTVFIKIFAAHCPSCWNYHQSHKLQNMYNMYGPNGTDEIMVLALEHDEYNGHNEFIGIGDPWQTQGNWLDGTPYPIFDVEWPDRGVFSDYNVNFYPVIYKVCPDMILEPISTSLTEAQLYQKVQECQSAVSISEVEEPGHIYWDRGTNNLVVQQFEKVQSLQVMDVSGHVLAARQSMSSSRISFPDLAPGVYLFGLQTEQGRVVKRFFVGR